MTEKEFSKRCKELQQQKARIKVYDFNGMIPIEYLKIEITEIEITNDSFRWKIEWGVNNGKFFKKGEKIVDWHKNFIFKVARLCGIDSESSYSQKLSKYSFLSQCAATRQMPSGKIMRKTAEGEFDAEIRADTAVLKDEIKKLNNSNHTLKYNNSAEKQLVATELAAHGRSLADTIAHKRVIVMMLEIDSAELELIGQKWFCFQCVPNFSHPAMQQKFLTRDVDPSLFGTSTIRQLPVAEIKDTEIEDAEIISDPAFDLEAMKPDWEDMPAINKLIDLVLDHPKDIEEFIQCLNGYRDHFAEERVPIILSWIIRYDLVPAGADKDYIKEWVNK